MEREIQRIDLERPLTIAEQVLLLGAKGYAQFLELPQQVRNYLVGEILESYLRGEKRSLYRDAKRLLSDQNLRVSGANLIPNEGPVLVIANHWNDGPLAGSWTWPAINLEVEKVLPHTDVKWIVNGDAHLPVSGVGVPYSNRLFRNVARQVYGSHVVGDSNDLAGGLRIVKSFKKGGSVGLFPEAHFSKELKEGDSKAGFIVAMMSSARPGGQVLPAGVYSEYNKLYLNFGPPFSMSDIFERSIPFPRDRKLKQEVAARIAHFLMEKIDALMPTQYRLKKRQ